MTDDSARIAKGGDIDPATVDLADRQARRARNRPATPPELRGWEDAAQRRMMRRPYPVNIMLEPAEIEGREHWTSPHDDPGLWTLQLAEALGTRSQAVLSTFVAHLEELVGATMWDAETERRRVNESEFSAMLSIINSQKPNDEMQAMLCAQMVAVHWLQMKVSARAIRYPYETKTVAAAGKLARTFVMQMDALQQAKGKRRTSRQTIKVTKEIHQHVHYHATQGAKETNANPMNRTDAPKLLTTAPLCQARTRAGTSCRSPCVKGKPRCRLHGARAGAPKGPDNGSWKDGNRSQEAVELHKRVNRLLRSIRSTAHA